MWKLLQATECSYLVVQRAIQADTCHARLPLQPPRVGLHAVARGQQLGLR